MLSLIQTADGPPVAQELPADLTAPAPTLLPTIRKLLQRWPLNRAVMMADRGLLSLNDLQEMDKASPERIGEVECS